MQVFSEKVRFLGKTEIIFYTKVVAVVTYTSNFFYLFGDVTDEKGFIIYGCRRCYGFGFQCSGH